MTTPRKDTLVSVAALLALALAPIACAHAPSHAVAGTPVPVESRPLTLRFDNTGREYVHVYLLGEEREWFLGRVDPGAIATLRIPEAALTGSSPLMRLAVLAGARVTLQAAHDRRATTTFVQPTSVILSHSWRFADGTLTSLALRDPGADGRRR
jgi:hypothetical protein